MRVHLLQSALAAALTGAAASLAPAPAAEALEIHALPTPPLGAESFPGAHADRRNGTSCRAFALLQPDIEIESGFARPERAVPVAVEVEREARAGFFIGSSQSPDTIHEAGGETPAGRVRQNDARSWVCLAAPPAGAA